MPQQWARAVMVGSLTVLGVGSVPTVIIGQLPAGKPAFDVAAVKENRSVEQSGRTSGVDAGQYTATNMPLYFLVLTTYSLLDHQLAGMPDWTRTTRYDIAASYPPGLRPNEQELKAMLQGLLADRFKLVAHHETRELPAYALTMANKDRKLGPQMSSSSVDCVKWLADGRPQIAAGPPSAIAPGGMRPECLLIANRRGILTAGTKPIKELAVALQSFVGRPVVDQTGLSGNFNMDMQWTPSASDASAPAGPPAADIGVSIFTALQEQLGLKLESTKASFDVLVVDHIERPIPD